MGAGLGPATAFLYSGPAINVLAIVLTARVLGLKMGIARAIGAIIFSVVIGLMMHLIFRKEEQAEKAKAQMQMPEPEVDPPALAERGLYFASMVGMLVFANWGRPDAEAADLACDMVVKMVYHIWVRAGIRRDTFRLVRHEAMETGVVAIPAAVACCAALPGHTGDRVRGGGGRPVGLSPERTRGRWAIGSTRPGDSPSRYCRFSSSGCWWRGLLLGRPGEEGLIPSEWVSSLVGGNSVGANLFASVAGAFMYFATLTEVPILEGLMGNGMGKGSGAGAAAGRPGLEPAQHAGDPQRDGNEEDPYSYSLVVVMAGVMNTPALGIDGEVVIEGKVASAEELETLLKP
jgi:uncharacterized protein